MLISSQEIESQIDRICEMGEVMRKAVQVDDDQFCKIQEKLAQLEVRLLPFQAHNISESFHRVWKVCHYYPIITCVDVFCMLMILN